MNHPDVPSNILVVDDQEDFADGVAEILEENGYGSQVVHSLEKALAAIEKNNINVALIDLRLGRSSGLELIDEIKSRRPDIECLIMTAYADIETAIGAVRKGAYDYLRKPIHTDELLTTLSRCCEKIRLRREKNRAEAALRQKNRALEEINRRLKKMVASTKGFASSACIDEFGELLLKEFSRNMAAQEGSIYMMSGKSLVLVYSLDPDHSPKTIHFPLKEGSILDKAIKCKTPILIENVIECKDIEPNGWIGYKDGSVLVFPLVDDLEQVLGIVMLHNRLDPPFTPQDMELGALLASHGCETLRAIKAVQALKEREHELTRLATAIDQAAELIFITDTNGNFQYVNPSFEQVTGYTRDEVLGQNVRLLKSGRQNDAFYQNLWQTITHGDVWRGKFVNRKKDGTLYTEEASITPICNDIGQIVNYVAVKRDITKLSMLEAQLRQVQKMEAIGTLAGGIAHDFNNILSAIMGYAELALLDTPQGETLATQLDKVIKASNRAKDLVSQILSFSRREEHELIPLDLKNVIFDTLKLIRASLPATIDIRKRIASEDRIILADQIQIHQLIMNICTNARYAMREKGGVLEITLEEATLDPEIGLSYPDLNPNNYLLLTIRDTGHGMSTDILERIFDPYFTTKKKGEGTGLGLAIVHTIVQNHNGKIRVKSEPGKGTTFFILFPHAARGALVQSEAASENIPGGNEKILVVDDEEDIALILEKMLDRLGYRVTSVSKSREALDIFKSDPNKFDAVITDMTMPEMTGEMLAARIKEIQPEIPVLLCTGYSETLPKGDYESLGVEGLLMKPISMNDMATTLRNVLDRRKVSQVTVIS